MPTPLRPAAAPTYGKENWVFVPTIAAAATGLPIPTAAEVNGATSLDITNMLFANGTDKPTQDTNIVDAERRLGDTTNYSRIGTAKVTGGTMTYAFDPQAAAASNGKKLFEKIPDGTTGYLVQRLGLSASTAATTGQFVNSFPVQFGPSLVGTAGDGESAEGAATCSYVVTGPAAQSVALT